MFWILRMLLIATLLFLTGYIFSSDTLLGLCLLVLCCAISTTTGYLTSKYCGEASRRYSPIRSFLHYIGIALGAAACLMPLIVLAFKYLKLLHGDGSLNSCVAIATFLPIFLGNLLLSSDQKEKYRGRPALSNRTVWFLKKLVGIRVQ